jgi:hypothetical protein
MIITDLILEAINESALFTAMRGRPHHYSGILPHPGVLNDTITTLTTGPRLGSDKKDYTDSCSNGIGYPK